MSNAGTRAERALCRAFDEAGWIVLRAPASGSATTRELPDVLVGKRDRGVLAIEAKYSSEDRIYLRREQVEGLQAVAKHFCGYALIAAQWRGERTMYAFSAEPEGTARSYRFGIKRAERVSEKSFRVHRDDVDDTLVLAQYDNDADDGEEPWRIRI